MILFHGTSNETTNLHVGQFWTDRIEDALSYCRNGGHVTAIRVNLDGLTEDCIEDWSEDAQCDDAEWTAAQTSDIAKFDDMTIDGDTMTAWCILSAEALAAVSAAPQATLACADLAMFDDVDDLEYMDADEDADEIAEITDAVARVKDAMAPILDGLSLDDVWSI